jgi:hypothetical protein
VTEIKLLICDSSDLRIKHVSIKTDAFRRDLCIRGLRSTIGATIQKVKFWSTLEPLSDIFLCYISSVDSATLLAISFMASSNIKKIKLVHFNPNSVLQVVVFIHLCEAYLAVLPNFALFKHYFFLKYQPSATKDQVMGSIGIQTLPH